MKLPNPLALLGLLFAAAPVLAQTQPAPLPTRISVTQRRIGSDTPPEPQADEQTTRLTGQLGLSAEQVPQVRAAALARAQAHQAMLRKYEAMHFVGTVPATEGQAIEDAFEEQLKAICTPEQYARHQIIRARFHRLSARADSLRRADNTK